MQVQCTTRATSCGSTASTRGSAYDALLSCDGDTRGRVRRMHEGAAEGPTIPHTRQELIGRLGAHGAVAIADDQERDGVRTCLAWCSRA